MTYLKLIPFIFAVVVAKLPAAQANATTGQTATFTVAVDGTAPFTYQWQKNGSNIAGATSASYVIPSLAVADAGSYTVVVTNPAGSTTSDTGTLLIIAPPSNAKVSIAISAVGTTQPAKVK